MSRLGVHLRQELSKRRNTHTHTHTHTQAFLHSNIYTHIPQQVRTFYSESFEHAGKVSLSLCVCLYISALALQSQINPLYSLGCSYMGLCVCVRACMCVCVWILNYKKSDSINKRRESALDTVKLSRGRGWHRPD